MPVEAPAGSAVSAPAGTNPLLSRLLAELRRQPAGLSEYELIQALANDWPPLADDASLALFQKHFLVMNGLYRLQGILWEEEALHLAISPLRIRLEWQRTVSDQLVGATADAALRDYYLDWDQFLNTDRAAVDTLLNAFWQRFHASDTVAAALAILGLGADVDWQQVRRAYRRLAAETHPDRGGDAERFLSVRSAYEQLRPHFRDR